MLDDLEVSQDLSALWNILLNLVLNNIIETQYLLVLDFIVYYYRLRLLKKDKVCLLLLSAV